MSSSAKNFTDQIWDLIDQNKIADADKKLKREVKVNPKNYDADDYIKEYDEAFLAVIEAYWDQRNYDAAESLALSYRSKINYDYDWKYNSAVYKFLEAKYKTIRRNFDVLEYK